MVLSTLGPAAYALNYKYHKVECIYIEDQFLIALMKLRRGMPDFELSITFSTSKKTITNIVITWINFMAAEWGELNLWPSKALIKYYMPDGFKKSYPSTRVIIDENEFPMPSPSNPAFLQATFSTYKNKHTLKNVVGMSPGGCITYISPSYAGSSSDRSLVERSDLTKKCEPNDSIMADRGFTVQDLFAAFNVLVNIPAFLNHSYLD